MLCLATFNSINNQLPDLVDGSCKAERFTNVSVAPRLKSFHTWECPVFALDENLQSSKKINKWNTRCRLGIYLGHSPRHAASVSLVLNLRTGHVSAQYHVQHDDFFETVRAHQNNPETVTNWQELAGLVGEKQGNASLPVLPNFQDAFGPPVDLNDAYSHSDIPVNDDEDPEMLQPPAQPTLNNQPVDPEAREPNQSVDSSNNHAYSTYYEDMHESEYLDQEKRDDPISYLAKTDADTMYLQQALQQEDRDQFIHAVIKEVNHHIQRGHWELVPVSSVPKGEKVLDAVWSVKRKRHILTRKVYKWKARLNVHGGQQEYAVNYYDTYAPVVT